MDTLKTPSSDIVSKYQNRNHHKFSFESADVPRKNHSFSNSSFDGLMKRTHEQVDLSFWNTSKTSPHIATSLLPLITKFETLDANSSVFSIKDAQPPHLRLPGSRMGRRNTREDPSQVKTTREKLLTLFDRPGWGAETLRGLGDIEQCRGFGDVPLLQTRGPSRSRNNEEVNPRGSPGVPRARDRKILSPRGKHRRGSIVRDRIRLFDGGMDISPISPKYPWRLTGAEVAVAPISPYKYHTTVSPNKQSDIFISPPKIGHGTLAPKTSLGYLRPNEKTPRPWRPLDIRRWIGSTTPTNSEETPHLRQQPHEQYGKSLVSPTPTNAVKRVQIIYQDPKRNISEKVTIQSDPRSNGIGRRDFENEIRDGHTQEILGPFTPARSKCKLTTLDISSENNEVALLEGLRLPKESNIQARIKLFSNEKANMTSPGVLSSRMRIQSTPTKLPSHTIYKIPTVSAERVPHLNGSIKSQLLKLSTKATEVENTGNEDYFRQLQSIGGQLSKFPVQELETQALDPRESSGVSDKIQRFEAFVSSQVPSDGSITVPKSRKRASSHSKRLQTWPRQAVESVPDAKSYESEVTKKPMDPEYSEQEPDSIMHPLKSNLRQLKTEKINKEIQDDQRAKYKIQSRQERLSRRSRSRSRSAPSISISEPTDQRDSESKHASKGSRSRRRKSRREATKALGVAIEFASNGASSHGQHGEGDVVQEIWIEGSQDGPLQEEPVVVDTVVAQCELAEPRPLRLVETLRMIRLCRGRFRERSGTWRRKVIGSSEKGAALAV